VTTRSLQGLIALVALSCAALVCARPASADDGITTMPLAQGPSHVLPLRQVVGASDQYVLSMGYDGLWRATSPVDGTEHVLASQSYWVPAYGAPLNRPTIAGDTVTAGSQGRYSSVSWARPDGTSGGTTVSARYGSAAPGGWLENDGSYVPVTNDSRTQLAVLPRTTDSLVTDLVVADERHAVFSWVERPSAGPSSRQFTVVDLQTHDVKQYQGPSTFCTTQLGNGLGIVCEPQLVDLADNGILWYDPTAQLLCRLSFTTGSTVTTSLPGESVDHVAATDRASGWTYDDASGHSFISTLVDGRVTTRPVRATGLAADDRTFWLELGSDDTTPGLYALPSADSSPVLLVKDVPVPATVYQPLAPTTGRVVWQDNQRSDATLWDRSGDGALLSDQRLIGGSVPSNDVVAGGRRTLYGVAIGSNPMPPAAPTAFYYTALETLGSGQQPQALPLYPDESTAVSGTRMLVRPRTYGGTWTVLDLVSGDRRTFDAVQADLWGNHVVYVTADGHVYWQDLSLPDATRVEVVDLSGHDVYGVVTAGDWVAWSSCSREPSGPCTHLDGYRDMHSLGAPVILSDRYLESLSDSYLVSVTSYSERLVRNLRTGGDTVLSGAFNTTADANRIAYSSYPGYAPTLTVLPDTGVPARVLGVNAVPTEVTRPVQAAWKGEIDASRALTGCVVEVRSATAIAAELPCQPDVLRYGAAVFSWDVRAVPDGTYTWTLRASDAHGPVQDAHGDDVPISGSVVVGSGSVLGSTSAATRTDGAWVTAFSSDVRGVTARNVRLRTVSGTAVPVTLSCLDAAAAAVPCTGWSRYAVLRPASPLVAGQPYQVDVDPADAPAPVLTVSGSAAARTSSAPSAPTTALSRTFAQRWSAVASSASIGGSFDAEARPGARISTTFTGSGVSLWFVGGPDRGTGQVWIDGKAMGLIDEYEPQVVVNDQAQYVGLTTGTHTLTVEVSARRNALSRGSLLTVDAIGALGSRTPRPLTQGWATSSSTATSSTISAAAPGSRAVVAFRGPRFVLRRTAGAAESPAQVYVDGAFVGTFAGTSATFSRSGLSAGAHTVTVVVAPLRGRALGSVSLLSLTT
jgi:hypothetical protein